MINAGGSVFQNTITRQDVSGIEINQVRLTGSMRVMASRAGGSKFLNVFAVITPARGLFAVHHRAAMALVAQRKIRLIVGRAIRQQLPALEQRNVGGTVRALGNGAAAARRLIVVMAVSAVGEAGNGPRQNEAGHEGIFPDGFYRMKRRVAGREFQARVRLGKLSLHPGGPAIAAVAVATET